MSLTKATKKFFGRTKNQKKKKGKWILYKNVRLAKTSFELRQERQDAREMKSIYFEFIIIFFSQNRCFVQVVDRILNGYKLNRAALLNSSGVKCVAVINRTEVKKGYIEPFVISFYDSIHASATEDEDRILLIEYGYEILFSSVLLANYFT